MRTSRIQCLTAIVATMTASLWLQTAQAQPATAASSPSPARAQGEHSSYFGGFIGATDRFNTDFTYGIQYEYRRASPWSVGMIVTRTPDVTPDNDYTLLLGTVNLRPNSYPNLKLTAGAGKEFKEFGDDDVRFRTGVGYQVFADGAFSLTPEVAYDFGEGREDVMFGATLNYRF